MVAVRRPYLLDAQQDRLLARLAEKPDLTLHAPATRALEAVGVVFIDQDAKKRSGRAAARSVALKITTIETWIDAAMVSIAQP